jgi:hypothetical protein
VNAPTPIPTDPPRAIPFDSTPALAAPDWKPSQALIESLARLLRSLGDDDDAQPAATPTKTGGNVNDNVVVT